MDNHDENMENMENIINVFILYYKKTFPNENLNSLFDNITNYDDTNKMMEHFYQCINDYKASELKSSWDYDETQLEELDEKYILVINNERKKMSDNVLSLLIDIGDNYIEDKWNIIDID